MQRFFLFILFFFSFARPLINSKPSDQTNRKAKIFNQYFIYKLINKKSNNLYTWSDYSYNINYKIPNFSFCESLSKVRNGNSIQYLIEMRVYNEMRFSEDDEKSWEYWTKLTLPSCKRSIFRVVIHITVQRRPKLVPTNVYVVSFLLGPWSLGADDQATEIVSSISSELQIVSL